MNTEIKSELEKIKEWSMEILATTCKLLAQTNANFETQVTCIECLGLSNRAVNCLVRNGILTVEELAQVGKTDLLKKRNIGKKTAKEITETLAIFKQNQGK